MVYCCLNGCPSRSEISSCSFFRIPVDERRHVWLSRIERSSVPPGARICGQHFVSGVYFFIHSFIHLFDSGIRQRGLQNTTHYEQSKNTENYTTTNQQEMLRSFKYATNALKQFCHERVEIRALLCRTVSKLGRSESKRLNQTERATVIQKLLIHLL